MKIAVTGATGFVGRALIQQLAREGHQLRCWFRQDQSDTSPLQEFDNSITWVNGKLGDDEAATRKLLDGCDQVVHSALWRSGPSFRGSEPDLIEYARVNILGSLQLIQTAQELGVDRFVFVSTCAVHEKILDDRPLDESHPLWAQNHYGAHKAAIEKFVHSFGFGDGMPICAIRPTGIYGIQHPVENSKWYSLVESIINGESIDVSGGGKEVHVDDVAKGIRILLANGSAGESYACYDRYISQFEVASLAKEISGSHSEIHGEPKTPKHEIETGKIEKLGMEFGGEEKLRETIRELVSYVHSKSSY